MEGKNIYVRSKKMNLPISILSNENPAMVKMDPFPHIILVDVLPLEFAANLTNSFPKHL